MLQYFWVILMYMHNHTLRISFGAKFDFKILGPCKTRFYFILFNKGIIKCSVNVSPLLHSFSACTAQQGDKQAEDKAEACLPVSRFSSPGRPCPCAASCPLSLMQKAIVSSFPFPFSFVSLGYSYLNY